ncbi:MAG: pilus assembly protein PilM [bacterium]|nr:pilus assembly protein PilM [bacterium]
MKRYASSGIIGLHFTQEELFLAHGQRAGQTFHVGSMDVIDITQHMLEGGEYNTLTLGPMIEEAVRSQRIKTRKAIISFPVKFPWIRVIDVPVMSQREMARIVRLEVERLYLDSTVEKLIDFFPLDDAKDKGPGGTMPVLSCAIPKNSVAPYIDLLEAANLELIGIDLVEVNVLKMAALQGVDFNDGITLILNFNTTSTDLMLMENNKLQLVRKVGQGKQQLREILNRTMPPDDMARRDLGNIDFTVPTEHLALAGEYVTSMLGEIRRSIEFYLTDIKRQEGNVSKVILAGSGYWPTNLPAILGMQLHLPMIDLKFERMPDVICETSFGREFPACGVYAPVLGSVLRGIG